MDDDEYDLDSYSHCSDDLDSDRIHQRDSSQSSSFVNLSSHSSSRARTLPETSQKGDNRDSAIIKKPGHHCCNFRLKKAIQLQQQQCFSVKRVSSMDTDVAMQVDWLPNSDHNRDHQGATTGTGTHHDDNYL